MAEDRTRKVLVFPARRPGGGGEESGLLFLFSMGQVEDILKTAAVHPVPFAPSHIQGMARWRGNVLPVLRPEGCLGMDGEGKRDRGTEGQRDKGTAAQGGGDARFVVVRAAVGEGTERRSERVMFRTAGPVELQPLPGGTAPAEIPAVIDRPDRVRGAYAWEDRFLIVLDIGRILTENLT